MAHSRSNKEALTTVGVFTPPDGAKAPSDLPVREALVKSSNVFLAELGKNLELEAFDLRLKTAQKVLKDLTKQSTERLRQTETAIREANHESDWQRLGDLLKNSLGTQPPGSLSEREVLDYETGEMLKIPCDPKLSPRDQVERFYPLARRKKRRIQEAEGRKETLQDNLSRMSQWMIMTPEPGDWAGLEKVEKAAQIQHQTGPLAAAPRGQRQGGWLGKTFTSKDGWTIWVGKSKDENLELTFKHARGNDLWMHIRGRPGAHVVIPVQPGKTVPLETLLDAATLAVFYSGGDKWGKTEVDYTFKKYVKRIKDSTEASYVNNKTLLIEPDPARIKRLVS
jgi:predicted ribosome quality control (RQC) complex YloA/Tae2 family protein